MTHSTNTINDKSEDGVHGTQTHGGTMVGADISTELYGGTPAADLCVGK